jgi:WD40 repeat protein
MASARDGQLLASAGQDGFVRLWDGASGKPLAALPFHHNASAALLALSADGRWLAIGEPLGPAIWEVAQRKKKYTLKEPNCRDLAFAPDGQTLASIANDRVRLWDAAMGTELRLLPAMPLPPLALVFAGDGQTLYVADTRGTMYRFDPGTGQQRGPPYALPQGSNSALALAPDGKTLARVTAVTVTGDSAELVLVDLASGKARTVVKLPDRIRHRLAFSLDSTLIAVTSSTNHGHKLLLCAAADGKVLVDQPLSTWAQPGVVFTVGGKTVATSGNLLLQRWNVGDGKEQLDHVSHNDLLWQVAWSPDGHTVASGDHFGHLCWWDAASGKRLRTVDTKTNSPFATLTFSPDGRRLLSNMVLGNVAFVWRVEDGQKLAALEPVASATFAPNGSIVASYADGRIGWWDEGNAVPVRLLRDHSEWALALAFSPDGGTLASAGKDTTVVLWSVRTGNLVHRLRGHLHPVQALAFSPDGLLLASASGNDLALWDTLTGDKVWQISLAADDLQRVCFTADSRALLLLTNQRIIAYDLTTRRAIGELPTAGTEPAACFGLSPDGKTLATGHRNGTILVWPMRLLLERAPRAWLSLPQAALQSLWNDLASDDAAVAFKARCTLAADNGSTAFLRQHLKPVAGPSAAKIAQLIADLDSDSFKVRDQAGRELKQMQEWVEEPLLKVLAGKPSLEVRRRIELLLSKFEHRPLSRQTVQALRAVAVLEALGSVEAREVLHVLAEGSPGARVTIAARAALTRWP